MDNPWASRFDALIDVKEIKRRALIEANPVEELLHFPVETAVKLLCHEMDRVYVPTNQHCEVIKYLLEIAYAHSLLTYPDKRTFIQTAYDEKFNLKPQQAICLTGLSGIGKSSLMSALSRVLPENGFLDLDRSHQNFPLRSALQLELRSKKSLGSILNHLSNANFPGESCPKKSDDAIRFLSKKAYLSGISLVTADEFQFLTQSSSANAKITEVLLALQDLGLPLVYVGNFSLCQRLMKRNDEDRQRLCSHPIILYPELSTSNDFRWQLSELRRVAPEFLNFDPETDSEQIYRYTAGVIRRFIMLIGIATRSVLLRKASRLNMMDIERAYKSIEYSAMQSDVIDINAQAIASENDESRKDLWSPYSKPKSFQKTQVQKRRDEHNEKVGLKLVQSSGTAKEQTALKKISARAGEVNQASKRKKRKPKNAVSTKEMLKALSRLKDEL